MKFIQKLNRKGQGVQSQANKLFGALMLIVLATALAPSMFEAILNLTGVSGVPAWVTTVLPIIVGMGLVFLIWRAFGSK